MKFSKTKLLLTFLVAGLFLMVQSVMVFAQPISYHSLRHATNQTSMAAGYFVRPAQITTSGNHYIVTMDCRTAKNLGSFPVKVLWVNNQAPLSIRKVKDSQGYSNYYYSFPIRNLGPRVIAKLAIDVPGVYKARHLIDFKFSTSNLPSLSSGSSASAAANNNNSNGKSSNSKKSSASKNKNNGSKNNKGKNANKNNKKNKNGKNGSSPSSNSANNTAAQPDKANSNKQSGNNPSKMPVIIGGIVVIIAAVLGGGYYFYRKN